MARSRRCMRPSPSRGVPGMEPPANSPWVLQRQSNLKSKCPDAKSPSGSSNTDRLSWQLAFGFSLKLLSWNKTRLPQFTAVSSSAIVTGGTNPFTICGFVVASRLNLVISKTAWQLNVSNIFDDIGSGSKTPMGQGEGSGQLSNKPQIGELANDLVTSISSAVLYNRHIMKGSIPWVSTQLQAASLSPETSQWEVVELL